MAEIRVIFFYLPLTFEKFARQTKSTVIQGYENLLLLYAKSAVILGYKCCFNFTLSKQSSRIIKRYKNVYVWSESVQNYQKFLFCKNIRNFFKDISFFLLFGLAAGKCARLLQYWLLSGCLFYSIHNTLALAYHVNDLQGFDKENNIE